MGKNKKPKQEIRRSAFIGGAQRSGPTLPVRDPHVTPITPTFKNAVKEAILPLGFICVCAEFLLGYRHHHLTRII